MEKRSFISGLREQISGAKGIAADMLTQPVEVSVAVAYSREIVQAFDGLERIDAQCLEIERELMRIENALMIGGHFSLRDGNEAGNEDDLGAVRKSRPLRIEIKAGAIRQNLLTLTKAVKRGLMTVGEEVSFLLPDGETLTSRIVRPGNRLRERGRVRELYREGNVTPGDFLVLEKMESGNWQITIERHQKVPFVS